MTLLIIGDSESELGQRHQKLDGRDPEEVSEVAGLLDIVPSPYNLCHV